MTILRLRPVAEKLFDDMRRLTFDGVGVTRESYGAGECAAAEYLCGFAASEGMEVVADRAANLVFRLPGTATADMVSWAGSHLDSVPQGGNYDGYAGVVAGLLCLLQQQRTGMRYAQPLEVVAFRGEESAWFGKAYLGSSALFGKLSAADLQLTDRTGTRTLAQCMAGCGADIEAIRSREALIDTSRIKSYLELHIEQGPVMEARDLPVAVVSGIRGNVRHKLITCTGDAQHSGVVPRDLRHDAMFAVADLIMRVDAHWLQLLEQNADLVVTAGVVGTDPAQHSISRVPGRVSFSLEIRSSSVETLEACYQLVRSECAAIERERGVQFGLDRRLLSAPATMHPGICGALSTACARAGVRFDTIPSGAGHDASLFANADIPTGMLFVRNQNGSHNPREAMDMADFMLGVDVMDRALSGLHDHPLPPPGRGPARPRTLYSTSICT